MSETINQDPSSATRKESRRTMKNPLSRTGANRENFPNLDNVFDTNDTTLEAKQALNESLCSVADSSSSLNMSIGARAALNEHMRHVARHGIDGEFTNQSMTDNDEDPLPSNPLDHQLEPGSDITFSSTPNLTES